MWDVDDFVPGQVSQAAEFWEQEILAACPRCMPDRTTAECPIEQQQRYLGWLAGVNVHEFVNENATGVFQGHPYKGKYLTPAELRNHVDAEHHPFVEETIAGYVRTGVVVPWREVADTKNSSQAADGHAARSRAFKT